MTLIHDLKIYSVHLYAKMHQSCKFGEIPPKQFLRYRVNNILVHDLHMDAQTARKQNAPGTILKTCSMHSLYTVSRKKDQNGGASDEIWYIVSHINLP